ncbi:MAG: WD40 repeat domain-containing protein [Planctomycetales bacterium]
MGSVGSLAFSPDGLLMATSGGSFEDAAPNWGGVHELGELATGPGRLKVWAVQVGTLRNDLVGHSHANAVAFSHDGAYLASAGSWQGAGSDHGSGVILWAPNTGIKLRTFPINTNGGTWSVAFSPKGKLMAISSRTFDQDNDTSTSSISLLRTATGILEWKQTVSGWGHPVAFSSDGKGVAVLCGGEAIRLFDTVTGAVKHNIGLADPSQGARWNDFALLPQGRLAIAGMDNSRQGKVEIWDFTGFSTAANLDGLRTTDPDATSAAHARPSPANTFAPVPQDLQSDAQLDLAIDISSRRQLTANVHSPWQIFHGLLALKQDFQLKLGDGNVNAIQWISSSDSQFENQPLLRKTVHGGKFHEFTRPYAFEGHPAQFLALLTQSDLPVDHAFKAGLEQITIGDIVNHTKKEVNNNEEVTWVLWALQHYLKPDAHWLNQHNESWSIERLVQMETTSPVVGAANGGNTRLFALTRARDKYLKHGWQLEGIWAQADQKIRQHIEIARSLQNSDGTFSTKFYEKPGHTTDIEQRLNTTGLTMEFLAIALPQERLNEPWVHSAVFALCDDLVTARQRQIDCDSFYHALNSLIIYRDRIRSTNRISRTGNEPGGTISPLVAVKLDRQNARAVVEVFVAAILASDSEYAQSLTENLSRNHMTDFANALSLERIERLAMKSVYVNDPTKPLTALAASEAVKLTLQQPHVQLDGVLMLPLTMSKEGWLVKDIGFESKDGAGDELKKFLEANPKSISVPPQGQAQPRKARVNPVVGHWKVVKLADMPLDQLAGATVVIDEHRVKMHVPSQKGPHPDWRYTLGANGDLDLVDADDAKGESASRAKYSLKGKTLSLALNAKKGDQPRPESATGDDPQKVVLYIVLELDEYATSGEATKSSDEGHGRREGNSPGPEQPGLSKTLKQLQGKWHLRRQIADDGDETATPSLSIWEFKDDRIIVRDDGPGGALLIKVDESHSPVQSQSHVCRRQLQHILYELPTAHKNRVHPRSVADDGSVPNQTRTRPCRCAIQPRASGCGSGGWGGHPASHGPQARRPDQQPLESEPVLNS